MLQNKLLFNQSSVSLEIIGLPDYSNNEKQDQISIISQWKLMINDEPPIEGNIDHLSSVMEAFYSYSNFLINNENAIYQSKLIDIKPENYLIHNVLLKSSKTDVKALSIKIGNSVLADIINCFDQFNSSKRVRKIRSNALVSRSKKSHLDFFNKDKLLSSLAPPLISICSLFLISSSFIYIYNKSADKDNVGFMQSKKILHSIKSINTIV